MLTMTKNLFAQIDAYIEANLTESVAQLARLCAQPSVSAQNLGITACAELVARMLREDDHHAELMPSKGNPVVYGESQGRSPKTLLFYLHYDVQPPEPLDLWQSPPFELTQRGDKLYARGVIDDKGHIVTRLAALKAVKAIMGELPCNVKFIIEGEEEICSPSLPDFITTHQAKLAADACVWEFGGVNAIGQPLQFLGMRGMCYVELSVRTANQDTHSGLGGSIFPNAAWRLVWALNSLKDEVERILIPGFYDNIIPPTETDLKLLGQLPNDTVNNLQAYELKQFLRGMTDPLALKVAEVFEPTCTICGLASGYQGPGSKTILPATARAKIDFRLVPEQTPAEVVEKLRHHLDEQGFDDIEITDLGGSRPARTDPNHPFIQLANQTYRDVYGYPPLVAPLTGGSGPYYPFVHILKLPIVTSGVGYPGGQIHAPNEHLRLPDFIKGIKHTARLIISLATT